MPDVKRNPAHPAGKRDIHIGNDVWIGMDSIILPGVRIGDGAIIGAGSVVAKDVSDYEVVAGNPARHIRFRFTSGQIADLRRIAWRDWPIEQIKANAGVLQSGNICIYSQIQANAVKCGDGRRCFNWRVTFQGRCYYKNSFIGSD